jgi:hypothetical protein
MYYWGSPMTRQIQWPSGASIADVTGRIAGVIVLRLCLKVFIGATVEFNLLESAEQLRRGWKLPPHYVANVQAPRRRDCVTWTEIRGGFERF